MAGASDDNHFTLLGERALLGIDRRVQVPVHNWNKLLGFDKVINWKVLHDVLMIDDELGVAAVADMLQSVTMLCEFAVVVDVPPH